MNSIVPNSIRGTNEAPATPEAALAIQRAAQRREPYPDATLRSDRLQRLEELLRTHSDELLRAMTDDFGYRAREQSYFAEIVTSLRSLRAARRGLRCWMRPQRRRAGFPFNLLGARARIQFQPLGVVGIISPWNFPINLTMGPLAGVLAAGNRALIKPSEHTPATADTLADLTRRYFDPDELSVITGDASIGQRFASLPLDHLVFTGSGAVAPHILTAAAPHLTPVTLELGGKSPVVIGEGAKLRRAANSVLFGKVFNAGQVCLAPDTVFLPRAQLRPFMDALRVAARQSIGSAESYRDYVAVINQRHAARLDSYLEDARTRGVELVELGPALPDAVARTNMRPITLVIDPPADCAISREEIFGPLLILRPYDAFAEVPGRLLDQDTPLALYYFGHSRKEQQQLLRETRSGGVTINDVIMHYTVDDLPFGGIGASGMGAYHGIHGFHRFSHARAVYYQSPFDTSALIRPPFGRSFAALSTWLARFG